MYIYIIIEEKSTSGTLPTNRRNIYVKSFTHAFNILLIATLLNDTHVRNNFTSIMCFLYATRHTVKMEGKKIQYELFFRLKG
jgi:hypothetical protein